MAEKFPAMPLIADYEETPWRNGRAWSHHNAGGVGVLREGAIRSILVGMYRAHKFAGLDGVSVRALHHYDPAGAPRAPQFIAKSRARGSRT